MGGHGGLNILPQKKWNVYNYDNRAIVDKDKKEAAAKKRAQYEKKRLGGLQGKIDVLLQEQGIRGPEEHQQTEQKQSLIVQQLKKIGQKNKHINLFEKEQQIIENREIQEMKRLQQAEFLKDKDTMDLSSKFLGTYADDKTQPWYAKYKGAEKPQRKPFINNSERYQSSAKRKDEKKDEKKAQKQLQRSRQKKQKVQETHKEQKSEIQKLREKRLRREQKERKRLKNLKMP